MIDFHPHWMSSGLPELTSPIVDSLDRAEASWVRKGSASALLSLQ